MTEYMTEYASVWDEFLDQIEGFASRVPLLTNLGNHEYDAEKATWRRGLVPDLYQASPPPPHPVASVPPTSPNSK
eukprot:7751362-Pyramimonas_sp.AAC.1